MALVFCSVLFQLQSRVPLGEFDGDSMVEVSEMAWEIREAAVFSSYEIF